MVLRHNSGVFSLFGHVNIVLIMSILQMKQTFFFFTKYLQDIFDHRKSWMRAKIVLLKHLNFCLDVTEMLLCTLMFEITQNQLMRLNCIRTIRFLAVNYTSS